MPLLASTFDAGEGDTTIYVQAGWTFFSSSLTTAQRHRSGFTGEGGDYSCVIGSGGSYARTPIFDSSTSRYGHVAVRLNESCDLYLKFRLGGAYQCAILLVGQSTAKLYRGNVATLLATSSATVIATVWHLLEWELDCQNSGRLRIYLDRSLVAFVDTGAGVDVQEQTGSGWDQIEFYSGSGSVWIDDLIVYTSAEGRADREYYGTALRPTSDFAGSTLTAVGTGSPSHYAVVDDSGAPDTTNYDEATAAGQGGKYGLGNLSWSPQAIECVVVYAYVARDGAITTYTVEIESGGSTDSGAATAIGAGGAYTTVTAIFDEDPDAGPGPWTEAAVNAMNAGGTFN